MSSPPELVGNPLEPDALLALLNERLPLPQRYWIAFSGGLDSTVLLNLLGPRRESLRAPLSAIHIDHGLQSVSAAWAAHCAQECERLKIPLQTLRVDAVAPRGESPEAAARQARYTAVAEAIGPDAMLLTAHHQDDQAETLLLALLRGAGVEGLAAMPLVRAWNRGWHARPLLGIGRADIRRWAIGRGLRWIEDPSNVSLTPDRNYLRHQVMPALSARWPAAAASLAQSAAHCATAAVLLTEEAELMLESVQAGHSQRLRVDRLRELTEAQACNVVRLWLRRQQLPPLPRRRLVEALHQINHARSDADLRIAWNGMELRRFREELWLLQGPPGVAPQAPLDWDGEERWLGPGLGRVRRRLGPGGIDLQSWTEGNVQIAYRHTGMRCRPAGRAGRRSFKKLAQECDIPPWLRAITPIVLIGDRPAAIANCCVCEPFAAPVGEDGWIVSWQPD